MNVNETTIPEENYLRRLGLWESLVWIAGAIWRLANEYSNYRNINSHNRANCLKTLERLKVFSGCHQRSNVRMEWVSLLEYKDSSIKFGKNSPGDLISLALFIGNFPFCTKISLW